MQVVGEPLEVRVGDSVEVKDSTAVEKADIEVLLQAAVVLTGEKSEEGQLIQGVGLAWFAILKELERDPQFLHRLDWRTLEELIAGAYREDGWPEVILTPRSGDGGKDIIATKPGIGSIRIIDQVKKYKPEHRVSADDVRALLGVLSLNPNVSKGIVTTTSSFAPGIRTDPQIVSFMPHRLELKDGQTLNAWLHEIGQKRGWR
jgi:restriction system protein